MSTLFTPLSAARPFTMTEEADIIHHEVYGDGYVWLEDSCAETQDGDRLFPVGDNLYMVTWAVQRRRQGKFFTTLKAALDEMEIVTTV